MGEPITFYASFPPIQSALKVGQDGARVQLDIPASEMAAIVRLHGCFGKVLTVTVQAEDDTGDRTKPRKTEPTDRAY